MAASSPEDITISLATEADLPAIHAIEDAAFSDRSLFDLIFPGEGHDPVLLTNESIERHRAYLRTDPTAHYTVARLPTTNEIVGFGKWNFFLTPESVARPQHPWPSDFGTGANNEMAEYFFGGLDRVRNEWMRKGRKEGEPGERHMLMAILCVKPEHQRKLIGKRLLEWGLEVADREGVQCWIDATPAGKGLYLKMGWRQVDELKIDLGQWGGKEGVIKTTVNMVREPHGAAKIS